MQLSLFYSFSAVAKLLTVSDTEPVVTVGILFLSNRPLFEIRGLFLSVLGCGCSFLSVLSLFFVSSSFVRRVARYGEVSPLFAVCAPSPPIRLLSLTVIDLRANYDYETLD